MKVSGVLKDYRAKYADRGSSIILRNSNSRRIKRLHFKNGPFLLSSMKKRIKLGSVLTRILLERKKQKYNNSQSQRLPKKQKNNNSQSQRLSKKQKINRKKKQFIKILVKCICCVEDLTIENLKEYFGQFCNLTDVLISLDSTGIAFLILRDLTMAKLLCEKDHIVNGIFVNVSIVGYGADYRKEAISHRVTDDPPVSRDTFSRRYGLKLETKTKLLPRYRALIKCCYSIGDLSGDDLRIYFSQYSPVTAVFMPQQYGEDFYVVMHKLTTAFRLSGKVHFVKGVFLYVDIVSCGY